ncbi:MAG: hypothetical protein E6J41_12825 [Chloroflexi bacterium]|nr:MAG: hypothetical protein E6J41_12825 [Chloroflexota bacterium]
MGSSAPAAGATPAVSAARGAAAAPAPTAGPASAATAVARTGAIRRHRPWAWPTSLRRLNIASIPRSSPARNHRPP